MGLYRSDLMRLDVSVLVLIGPYASLWGFMVS